MRRPEGFDAAPEAPVRSSRRPRIRLGRPAEGPTSPETAAAAGAAPSPSPRPAEPSAPAEPVAEPSEADPRAALRAAARERRRAERAEIRRFTRASRRRRNAWIIAGAVVVSIVGLVAVLVFSPALALREIEVVGAERLDGAQIEEALEGQLGVPLVFVDERRIADELGDFALIRSYVVELLPPSTMRVVIEERQPIGVVVSGSVFQLIDPAGIVVESIETRPEGVPLIDLPVGDDGTVRQAIAEVLLALPADVLERVDRVTATTRDDVSFTMHRSDQRVVWGGAAGSERKALVLAALLETWAGKGPGEYDVSGSGSATFRQF